MPAKINDYKVYYYISKREKVLKRHKNRAKFYRIIFTYLIVINFCGIKFSRELIFAVTNFRDLAKFAKLVPAKYSKSENSRKLVPAKINAREN